MARYPDTPGPQTPYPWVPSRPAARGGPVWAPKTRALTRTGLFSVELTYRGLSWTDVMALFAFWESVEGPNGVFAFADFNGYVKGATPSPGKPWTNLIVAVGEYPQSEWTLPTYQIATSPAPVVKVAGATKTVTTDYYVTAGAGSDGLDRINFTTAVPDGHVITIDCTCRRAMKRARFVGDAFPFATQVNPLVLQSGTVQIIEVR